MQCPACLCSANQKITLNSVEYLECSFCGDLRLPKDSDDDFPQVLSKNLYEEVKTLRMKLKEANEIIERQKLPSSLLSA